MIVTLLAHTDLVGLPGVVEGTEFGKMESWWSGEYSDADRLAHLSGRACYQAWEMPNPATQSDEGYLNNIIHQGHFSVLEHATATFYIQGVSRNFLAEVTRHRHLSFSVESQRYVDYSKTEPVYPPAADDFMKRKIKTLYDLALKEYSEAVDYYTTQGLKRKQAREAARFLLPSAAPVDMVITANHRAWREVIQKRNNDHADREIHEVAEELLTQLKKIAPGCYQDL